MLLQLKEPTNTLNLLSDSRGQNRQGVGLRQSNLALSPMDLQFHIKVLDRRPDPLLFSHLPLQTVSLRQHQHSLEGIRRLWQKTFNGCMSHTLRHRRIRQLPLQCKDFRMRSILITKQVQELPLQEHSLGLRWVQQLLGLCHRSP